MRDAEYKNANRAQKMVRLTAKFKQQKAFPVWHNGS